MVKGERRKAKGILGNLGISRQMSTVVRIRFLQTSSPIFISNDHAPTSAPRFQSHRQFQLQFNPCVCLLCDHSFTSAQKMSHLNICQPTSFPIDPMRRAFWGWVLPQQEDHCQYRFRLSMSHFESRDATSHLWNPIL